MSWMIQDWTTGELNALVKNLGGEKIARRIQRGEMKVSLKDNKKPLFDKHGRRIPDNLQSDFCDADRNYQLIPPKMETVDDYIYRIELLYTCLRLCGHDINTEVSAEQLKIETERLLDFIRNDSQIANIANGVWLPVVLPRIAIHDIKYVDALEQFLKSVSASYVRSFVNRKFNDYRPRNLPDNYIIINESRHNNLIRMMNHKSGFGIHFPNPLQGFSVNAQREQMSTLPERFILSGIDTIIAMIMYPDILARDIKTPKLDLSAFYREYTNDLLFFNAHNDSLDIRYIGGESLDAAFSIHSGGLLFTNVK